LISGQFLIGKFPGISKRFSRQWIIHPQIYGFSLLRASMHYIRKNTTILLFIFKIELQQFGNDGFASLA
jgi:hypothetical protein